MTVHHTLMNRPSSLGDRARWRSGLPELTDGLVVLRELRATDAGSILGHLNRLPVTRYIAPCPSTEEGFRRFIRWTRDQRRRGQHVCYGVIPSGQSAPVGLIQIWPIEPDYSTAEWGFVVGDAYWGTGLFMRSARLFLDAVFSDALLGASTVCRLEARAVDANGRGNGVLRKLGATREGVLRSAFRDGDVVSDHVMWSVLDHEWTAQRNRVRNAS